MLNSWGTGDGRRPNGTFRMAMHTKYSAVVIPGMGDPVPIFTWGLLDTQFTTKARKGVASLAINLQDASPGANSIQISGVSFPPAAAPTNVYAAGLSLNGQSFSCDPAKGTWTADTNGFHYLSGAGVVPGLQVDINPVTCTWSFTATNVSADQARYIDSHYGLNFSFAYQPTADAPSLDLGGLHAFMYDELANAASGQYTNPAPDAPSLSFRLTGAQGVLRIAGETGRTCQVQETGALGSLWAVRTIVPMTQPVQEVTLFRARRHQTASGASRSSKALARSFISPQTLTDTPDYDPMPLILPAGCPCGRRSTLTSNSPSPAPPPPPRCPSAASARSPGPRRAWKANS